jgi:uncharacterized protein (TIGR03067 family)
MRRLTAWAGLMSLLVVAVAAVAVRADEAKVSGDLKKIQGTWVRSGDDGPDSSWKFDGETLKASVNGMDYTCSVKLDEKAKPHASVDLTVKDGPGDSTGKTAKGIYKFDGAKLVLCIAMPGVEARPADFKTVEDEVHLFELKKE